MSQVNLKVQVYCLKPKWVNFEKNKYRLYVNEDMLTERSWVWDNNIFLDEDVWVSNLDVENSLKLEPVIHIPSQASFTINNFRVPNIPATSTKVINDLQVNFTLR